MPTMMAPRDFLKGMYLKGPSMRKPSVMRIAPTTSTNFGEFLVTLESQRKPQSGRERP